MVMIEYKLKLENLYDSLSLIRENILEIGRFVYNRPRESVFGLLTTFYMSGCSSSEKIVRPKIEIARSALEESLSANEEQLKMFYTNDTLSYEDLPSHIRNLKAEFFGDKLIVGEKSIGFDTLDVSINRFGHENGDTTFTFVMPRTSAYIDMMIRVTKEGEAINLIY